MTSEMTSDTINLGLDTRPNWLTGGSKGQGDRAPSPLYP